MDSIAEKFSVFDYINLFIGGFVFIVGIGFGGYPKFGESILSLFATIEESKLLFIISIIILIVVSFIVGAIINEVGHFFFNTVFKLEKKERQKCLIGPKDTKNPEKYKRYRKAIAHFFPHKLDKEDFSLEEYSDYFEHCVYYLHVRNQDKKTERLRELRGLSMLLSWTFALIPLGILIIAAIAQNIADNGSMILLFCASSLLFAVAFYWKYKRDMSNRIKMVLEIYDACTDMGNNTDEPQQNKKRKVK